MRTEAEAALFPWKQTSLLGSLVLFGTACVQDYNIVPTPVDVDPGVVTECPFVQVEDTDFYAYDCNPVFSAESTGEVWAQEIDSLAFLATLVMGHPFYQLWYVGKAGEGPGQDYGLGYAVSTQGTDWEPAGTNPGLTESDNSAWDYSSMDALRVVWDPESASYVGLYQGLNVTQGNLGLGVVTSLDGRSWVKHPANPVMNLAQPYGAVKQWCWPLTLTLGEIAGFSAYVAGAFRALDARDLDKSKCEVFSLAAGGLSDWNPSDTRILAAGDDGAWDDQGFISMAIAELEGVRYLFYVGFGGWTTSTGGYVHTEGQFLGMATSVDGGAWEKDPDIIPLHQTSVGEVKMVAAQTVGSRIHLWVTDEYDSGLAVGYFLLDPHRAEEGGDSG